MNRARHAVLFAILTPLAACDGPRSPISYGAPTSIIVVTPDRIWAELQDTIRVMLEPRVFTVRDERAFDVTQVDPSRGEWGRLRLFRQVLVIGRAEDPWVAPVVSGSDAPRAYPARVEARNVWARGQHVTAVVLPPDGSLERVVELLPGIQEGVEARFQAYVLERMFVSGVDERLRDRLAREAGFSIVLPEVYRDVSVPEAYIFRNDFPDPSRLVRSLLVTWKPHGTVALTPETLLAWRDTMSERHYARPMVTLRNPLQIAPLTREQEGVEVQGLWESPAGMWPGGGPFIARLVACPDQGRTYLLDAWLYAPGRDKLEYLVQIQTILGTFRCGATAVAGAR